jgi:NitT/TauT family transport system substrate-binding protein
MITTSRAMIESKSDVVQRFVDASIEGWYNYLYGDNSKANALIKTDNPEMTDGQIAYSIAKMKEYGIVESGEALDKGIGCMTDAHYKKFYDEMVGIKVVKSDTDYTKAFTTKFVCKSTGMALRK